MKCVLLSGGGGLRLWPLSRKHFPKQFLSLSDGESMFCKAIERNRPLFSDFMIVTNEAYRYMIINELERMSTLSSQLVLESHGRNTAAAIAVAALLSDPDDILLIAPTDALIDDLPDYAKAIHEAESLAEEGAIVTFGIKPQSPHTGYGYIRYSGHDVISFKEKPDQVTAERYLQEGDYLWNSGMFMFRAGVMLTELQLYRDDILQACKSMIDRLDTASDPLILPPGDMLEIPAESIDYAVIENSKAIKVVPSDFYWNDMGGLEAFSDIAEPDTSGNRSRGGNTIVSGCHDVSVINDAENSLVVANNLDDLVITNTNNAVYVTKKGSSEKIKQIIGVYNDEYGRFFDENVRSYRPWGYYEVLVNAPHYKVKLITVYPGKRLSLQRHFHRSEHWTIAEGVATITLGQETREYRANESTYIPIGVLHRLGNDTDNSLEIIEVSLGDILSEDDIERIEDDFVR